NVYMKIVNNMCSYFLSDNVVAAAGPITELIAGWLVSSGCRLATPSGATAPSLFLSVSNRPFIYSSVNPVKTNPLSRLAQASWQLEDPGPWRRLIVQDELDSPPTNWIHPRIAGV